MFGEDSSGRKVSLLNAPPLSHHRHHHLSSKVNRPRRVQQASDSASSISSRSRDGRASPSSRSSLTSSPRHSPPTPPPGHHKSRSAINTPSTSSPMTPHYGFDPLDHHGKNNGLPYYPQFPRSGFPPLQETNPPYYNDLVPQQPLPPLHPTSIYNVEDGSWVQRAAMNRLQTQQQFHQQQQQHQYQHQLQQQQLGQHYSTDPSLHQISPINPSPTSLLSAGTDNSPSSITTPKSGQKPAHKTTSNISAPRNSVTPGTDQQQQSRTSSTSKRLSNNRSIGSSNDASTPTTASGTKKKYPCPHAAKHNCSDTFTTSGHAARHGKKHTGEKNIICPSCNKAFTRKDNMKQHERTHKGGTRPGSISPSSSSKGVGGRGTGGNDSRRASNATVMSNGDGMDVDDDDQHAGLIPGEGGIDGAIRKRPSMRRSELSEILESASGGRDIRGSVKTLDGLADADGEADGEGESPGLDALANAAAGAMT